LPSPIRLSVPSPPFFTPGYRWKGSSHRWDRQAPKRTRKDFSAVTNPFYCPLFFFFPASRLHFKVCLNTLLYQLISRAPFECLTTSSMLFFLTPHTIVFFDIAFSKDLVLWACLNALTMKASVRKSPLSFETLFHFSLYFRPPTSMTLGSLFSLAGFANKLFWISLTSSAVNDPIFPFFGKPVAGLAFFFPVCHPCS